MTWSIVALAASISLAIALGLIHSTEKVNALWIIIAAGCIYSIAYRFYAAFIATKVLTLDPRTVTPALRLTDGVDYDPTNQWVLFGHHFAAIAGAGPLIGPMLAAQFGYAPCFLWILIGATLAGAVHDMVILFASVRRNGKSLAQIAKDEIGPVGGFAASIAIIFIIIVALAGLGLAVVNALKNSPWGAFTIGLTVPIALVMGLYLRFYRPGKIGEVSILGVFALLFAVFAGHFVPHSFLGALFNLSEKNVIVCLCIYGFIASILVPGDYFAINSKLSLHAITALGFAPDKINELSALVGVNVQGRPGGAVSLAVGMSSILSNISGMKRLMPYWYNFALMFEAMFILTTVDAGTRVARFLVQELGGLAYKPLSRPRWLHGSLCKSSTLMRGMPPRQRSGLPSTSMPGSSF